CIGSDPDVLLLDEPTNHLDQDSIAWLRGCLRRFNGAVVLVSHDRAFLDETASRVFSFERGVVVPCEGNYTAYLRDRDLLLQRQWADYNAEQRRLDADRAAAEKRMSLSRKVARPPAGVKSSQDFYNRKAAQVARTARLLKERARLRPSITKPWEEQSIPDLTFEHVRRSGDIAVSASRLSFSYGGHGVFDDLNFQIRRGERWVLTGANGAGKSTLMRLISGAAEPVSGAIQLGAHTGIAHLPQEFDDLDHNCTPLDICLAERNDVTLARTLLGCLKLPAALIERPLPTLSAGERTKSALARMLLSGANVLLLDEPTNHLEIEAREALEAALRRFPGTLIFTSHDPWFVRSLATHSLSLPACAISIES
ncbi:MAG TPA: ATP-binding cassette domain-containing protein, partial [Bryobacteraceae bacterium]|nr:ATP-binding cassette domain-containing protein [Bryobacteraceae bacterium]